MCLSKKSTTFEIKSCLNSFLIVLFEKLSCDISNCSSFAIAYE